MSVEALSYVWKQAPVKSADLLVLLALADWADENGWCYPTLKAVARKSRLTVDATRNVIARLHNEGHLTIFDHFVENLQTQNYYRLALPDVSDTHRPMTRGRLVERARTPLTPTEGGTPVSTTPPPFGTEGGTPSPTEGPPPSGTEGENPSIEPSLEPPKIKETTATPAHTRESRPSIQSVGESPDSSPSTSERPNIFGAWERVAGPLTGQISDALQDAVRQFGEPFVTSAIEEMGKSGARPSLKYLQAILDTCQREKRSPGQPRPLRPPAAQQAAKRAATEDPENWAGKASNLPPPSPVRSAIPPGWTPPNKEKAS